VYACCDCSVGLCNGCEWLDGVCFRGLVTAPVLSQLKECCLLPAPLPMDVCAIIQTSMPHPYTVTLLTAQALAACSGLPHGQALPVSTSKEGIGTHYIYIYSIGVQVSTCSNKKCAHTGTAFCFPELRRSRDETYRPCDLVTLTFDLETGAQYG